MLAHKKNRSLANILVRSRLKDPNPQSFTHLSQRPHRTDPKPKVNQDIDKLFPKGYPMKKCGARNCKICHKLKTIYNRKCKLNFPIPKWKQPLTCWHKRIVYAIKCKVCHETYVGQTIQPLRTRIARHLYNVRRQTNHHMSHHFNKICSIDDLQFLPLEKIDDHLPPERPNEI